ncbi:UDP-N-acetylglucosamine pyrophosphorylase [Rhizophlyctis rosea]|uniref:UDP-N-acetylglucosamine diphosphorylase n=1 Tax=Rhizophlyctis rosea TaxID=64517 RepID=A0AAD5SQY6_9FUNG|nr:UDP-N-acetylglucosamine pyrophosphorylase [Rhizophlyctis rosea]
MAEHIKNTFESAGQGHVFSFWDSSSQDERSQLLKNLEDIDVERVNKIFKTATSVAPSAAQDSIAPLPESSFDTTRKDPAKVKAWEEKGLQLMGQNKVAVILLAGGQGTRLGSAEPKGCYDIGLPSGKSLFQLQGERILKLQKLATKYSDGKEVIIPWYVMTSGPTRKATETFFEKHNFFGLRPENVIFFEQGVLPAFTPDGKIFLESKTTPAVAPDGNGGIYAALDRQGVISDLERRGIPYVHAYCVDNCLVKVADPVFIGYCVGKNADCGAKSVPKAYAEEAVGVICYRNGKPGVVEYSEIDKELAAQKNENGDLVYNAGNIANHFYTTEFLRRVKSFEHQLEYHIAHKKIPHVDLQSGEKIKPTATNGIKLELFIFDVIPFTERFAVLEVPRAEEFSPLKNATGSDSPETSRNDILAQGKRYVEAAGAKVAADVKVEVGPLASYGGEGLEELHGVDIKESVALLTEEDVRKLKQ